MSSAIGPITTIAATSSCCDKNTATTFLSLIAAVAGVAYSIFNASILGTIGFLLLGISTLIFRSINDTKLENVETEIAKVTALHAVEMEQETGKMSTEITDLKQNRELMQNQLLVLQNDNLQRQAIQAKLETTEAELRTEIATLKQLKTETEQNLIAMKTSSKQIQTKVQEMLQNNLTVGTTIGAFGQAVSHLAQHEFQLSTEVGNFQQELEVDMTKLPQQIQLAKDSMTSITNKANEINLAFKANLNRTQELENQLHIMTESARQEEEKLEQSLSISIARQNQLSQSERQIQLEEETLNTKIAHLKTVEIQLTKLAQDKTEEICSLEKSKLEIEQLITNKLKIMQTLDQKIAQKEPLLKAAQIAPTHTNGN